MRQCQADEVSRWRSLPIQQHDCTCLNSTSAGRSNDCARLDSIPQVEAMTVLLTIPSLQDEAMTVLVSMPSAKASLPDQALLSERMLHGWEFEVLISLQVADIPQLLHTGQNGNSFVRQSAWSMPLAFPAEMHVRKPPSSRMSCSTLAACNGCSLKYDQCTLNSLPSQTLITPSQVCGVWSMHIESASITNVENSITGMWRMVNAH